MPEWIDAEPPRFYERWQRRGETVVVIGVTATLTLVASAAGRPHTNWWPLAVAIPIVAFGAYLVIAADQQWWLPGRRSMLNGATQRFMSDPHGWDDLRAQAQERRLMEGLRSISDALRNQAQAARGLGSATPVSRQWITK
jgi:hypothetical protein